ncbi:MAG: type I methionyl aminopeptidase [Patescibacteria group bacterium]
MIKTKTSEEIKILAEGGKKLSEVLSVLRDKVKAGMNSTELENLAKKLIKEAGAEPAFLGYRSHGGKPYPAALCISVGSAVVHTPASIPYEIKPGDVVSLDLGLTYKGLCTDMATTVIVSPADKKTQQLSNTTREALEAAILECRAGAPISNIGKRVEDIVKKAGFSIVKELVGHGVGYEVHEDPAVPNYFTKASERDIMKEGLVIAIEPMVSMGSGRIKLGEDNITYETIDGSLAAHFEATVAITKEGPIVLTPVI